MIVVTKKSFQFFHFTFISTPGIDIGYKNTILQQKQEDRLTYTYIAKFCPRKFYFRIMCVHDKESKKNLMPIYESSVMYLRNSSKI